MGFNYEGVETKCNAGGQGGIITCQQTRQTFPGEWREGSDHVTNGKRMKNRNVEQSANGAGSEHVQDESTRTHHGPGQSHDVDGAARRRSQRLIGERKRGKLDVPKWMLEHFTEGYAGGRVLGEAAGEKVVECGGEYAQDVTKM
jgi:hypothetical protein